MIWSKGIHSIYSLVKTKNSLDVFNGNAYIFMGRTRKSIKILRWQKEGFVLYTKKLELGRYFLPSKISNTAFYELKQEKVI
ncbi:MAG: IS66 family insertion sequence element accessory protein TnpB [Marinifilaceae bacterium]|nr:IS66 family insertion sequence element accessory protein TnpB [Marinifilaceae bacterium]